MNIIQDILNRLEVMPDTMGLKDLIEIGLYRNSNHAQRMGRHGFLPPRCSNLSQLTFEKELLIQFIKNNSITIIKKLDEEDKRTTKKEQKEIFGADKFMKVEKLVDKFKKDLIDLMNG
jgi:hypothetical protein